MVLALEVLFDIYLKQYTKDCTDLIIYQKMQLVKETLDYIRVIISCSIRWRGWQMLN